MANQGFPRSRGVGEQQPLDLGQKSIIWQDIHKKLHENERNQTDIRRGVHPYNPLGSANKPTDTNGVWPWTQSPLPAGCRPHVSGTPSLLVSTPQPLDADPYCHVTCDARWQANSCLPVNRITDTCKNITLPQILFYRQ